MKEKNWKKQVSKYVVTDYMAAAFSWVSFFLFRKVIIAKPEVFSIQSDILADSAFVKGIIVIPLFWLLLYYVAGEYHSIFRRSRLQELGRTLFVGTLGVILIFFVLILDDTIVFV